MDGSGGVTSFFYGLGMTEADFDKPQVGIGIPRFEGNLCNLHAYELGRKVAGRVSSRET